MREKGQSLVEAAVGIPILLLTLLGIINLAMFGLAGMNASNAANYGARQASVAQSNVQAIALGNTQAKLSEVSVGTYTVTVSGGGERGDLIRIMVDYQVTNFFGGLAGFFGGSSDELRGQTVSYFRQEGW
ncbi:MAG: TadE/TadG family type IV pilus assembly protein [Chloroflexota bacterium]|nr:TadE/TadG family type IV pilus assembly protein [Chloroflexota bacterium]